MVLIHTCGADGWVALAEGDEVRAEAGLPGRQASERLVPELRRLLGELGWSVNELGSVAVVTGPGSFTGVRVGLSAAKGICEAVGVGMVGISRLELVAEDSGADVAVLDAGRGEFYCGGGGVGEELLDAKGARKLIAVRAAVSPEAKVVEALEGVRLVPEPGPAAMLRMGLLRIEAGEWSDVALTDANYLRRTDAELLGKMKG